MTKRKFLIMMPRIAIVAVFALMAFLPGCMKRQCTLSPLPGSASGMAPGFSGGGGGLARSAVPLPAVGAEEVWILARGDQPRASAEEGTPGSGALMAKLEEKMVEMPLKHTDVRASVSGYLGTVEVIQQFHNTYSSKIEAVYVFPLPHNAAVNEFIMTIGERRIRGIIRERAEAERIYQDAKRQGYVASLLTEERPNVFTQSVANIEPGKEIDVHIRYFHTLDYVDGWYEFVFPMVVGRRYW